jgi:hypothetical protein
MWRQIMALLAAVVFPTSAIIKGVDRPIVSPKLSVRFGVAVIRIALAFGVAMMGAIAVAALLADYSFVVGARQFVGVKIAFVLPILLVFGYAYIGPQRISSLGPMIRRVLNAPVKYSALILMGVSVIFVAIYLIRSGNYMVAAPAGSEKNAREWLETVLLVRPRTKEILVGYPLLMGTMMLAKSSPLYRWRWVGLCGGSVAFISALNSFCHVHSPLILSLYRGVLGVVLGSVIVGVMIGIGKGIQWFLTSK